jgi:hypothetical protein
MNTPDKQDSNPDDLAASYGVQQFTQLIPQRKPNQPDPRQTAAARHLQAAKNLARTIGISWLKIRHSNTKAE